MKQTLIVKCNHCKHEWQYKGNNKHFITCPDCYKKVNINKEART